MEDKDLTLNEAVKIINSYFPDDKPLFVVDGNKFKASSSDWRERLKLKEMETGYLKMERIIVTKDVTMEDIAKRIQYFTDRANEIHVLISKDKAQAKREYIKLCEEQNSEYNELTLVKNKQIVNSLGALRAYRGYFGHLHFIKNTYDNLSWNLGEFSQGQSWFNVFGKDIED